MARQAALPPNLPPRLICRRAAAAYLGICATTFDILVGGGTMPRPKRIGARKLWDVRALDAAVDDLPGDGPTHSEDDTWKAIDAA